MKTQKMRRIIIEKKKEAARGNQAIITGYGALTGSKWRH
jgi:hypothetical protein